MLGTIVLWGVIGACAATTVIITALSLWKWHSEPERARRRRAAANQKWVRDKCRANHLHVEEEARLVAAFYQQMEGVHDFTNWK